MMQVQERDMQVVLGWCTVHILKDEVIVYPDVLGPLPLVSVTRNRIKKIIEAGECISIKHKK